MAITPSNSFSYNLPSIDKMCVNRVKVGYVELGEGKAEDNQFTVKKEEIFEKDGKHYVEIELKNFYKKIVLVERYNDSYFDIPVETLKFNATTFQRLKIELSSDLNDIYLIVNSQTIYGLNEKDYTLNDRVSQINNGLSEFEVKSGLLIAGKEQAEKTAERLMQVYSKGRGYVDTNWIGTPELKIGDCFTGVSIKEQASYNYETCSNEFVLEKGFRMKTKAREQVAN